MMKMFAILLSAFFLLHCGEEIKTLVEDASAGQASEDLPRQPVTKGVALLDTTGNVAVDAGFAMHGTVLGIPAGFTAAQCKFTAAPSSIDGSALSIHVSMDDTSGEVTCQKVVQERDEIPPVARDCVASYTILCVK